ncbi:MAG TPA: response regulator [Tepidisphaeraceae bacterium]|nr:response regulator [Tepidisphaeraceae bacterium]
MNLDEEWAATARATREEILRPPLIGRRRTGITLALLATGAAISRCDGLIAADYLPLISMGLFLLAMLLIASMHTLLLREGGKLLDLDRRLRQEIDRLESALKDKGNQIAWSSREIRGPLTAIFGCCDQSWEGQLMEQARQVVRRNANQILAVTQKMSGGDDAARAETPPDAAPQLAGRVLLAEDGEDNRKVIEFYLQKTGVQFTTVTDGQNAYDQAMASKKSGHPFDLILMDVQMPVSDGCEATILLRDHHYRSPIVALTANATERDRQRCMASGYNAFLTKPIDVQKLADVLSRYLRPAGQVFSSAVIAETISAPDPAFAALRQSFLGEIGKRIAAIEHAVESQDTTAAADLSHQLKGTAGCYGFPEVSQAASALQLAAEKADGAQVEPLFLTLKELCRQATKKAA